jgi:hypothetical protein
MPTPRLCIRLDDLAGTPGHTVAACEALRIGLATAGGIMVVTDEWPHSVGAIKALHDERRPVDLGLHITLNCEWKGQNWSPVTPKEQVPDLVDEQGHLLPSPKDMDERGGYAVEQMLLEADAQLDRLRSAGIEPAYVDDHMGFPWAASGDGNAALDDWCDRNGLLRGSHQDSFSLGKFRGDDGSFDCAAILAAIPEGPPKMGVLHPSITTEVERDLIVKFGDAKPGDFVWERENDWKLVTDSPLVDAFREGRLEAARIGDVAIKASRY